jgi:hypothetical protein
LPRPDVHLTGELTKTNIATAAMLLTAYTKSKPGENARIKIIKRQEESYITVTACKSSEFKDLLI